MSWEEATHAWAEQNGADDGFYVQVREDQQCLERLVSMSCIQSTVCKVLIESVDS